MYCNIINRFIIKGVSQFSDEFDFSECFQTLNFLDLEEDVRTKNSGYLTSLFQRYSVFSENIFFTFKYIEKKPYRINF